ncbi:MAG TPA: DciA family protein [Alphaproteobacteria bacterium]|nr:DciA family protein [Alphaproteobacteria bacterium]
MSRPRALAAIVQPLARQALGKRYAAIGALIADWPAIVGGHLASRAVPDGLSFPKGRRDGGVLRLRADAADALEIQHETPRILERINAHYGYRAVERIALVQAPPPKRHRRRPARPLSPTEQKTIDEALAGVEEPELRGRLADLGRSIFRKGDRT